MNAPTRKKIGLFVEFKRDLLRKLTGGFILVTLLTIALALLHEQYPEKLKVGAQLPGYMGVALGLLLVFRNNTAYEKWWEARKEIGNLVNTSRNIGITINGIIVHQNNEKFAIAKLLKAFVTSLKGHLRDGVDMEVLKEIGLGPKEYMKIKKASHKPNIIVNLMMTHVETLYLKKQITDVQQEVLIRHLNQLIEILGKCERIRNTPIPMAYGFLLKFFITLYVVVLPLGLIHDLGWWSIPLVIILYFIMMSIVLTAEEIEEPFGKDINDLPMDQIVQNIKNNIDEIVEHH
jgi:ion channel-forming bestrophin family protein